MKKILIVGKKGFIGNSLYKYLKKYFDVKLVDFRTFTKTKKINNFNYIINCSINKNYAFKKYDKKYDFDLKICNKIKSYDIKQIFLSTRKIYENRANIKETSKKLPSCNYSKNKLISEKKLKKILKNKILILRISNIIGQKSKIKYRKIHNTFQDVFFKNVKNGIIFDNKKAFKDFLPQALFNKIIKNLISMNLSGEFNISLGRKVYLNKVVQWLNYYNKNKVRVVNYTKLNNYKNDSFYLNNSKLIKKTGIKIRLIDLEREIKKISKNYFYEK